MIILGIETSCDETALALLETRPGTNLGTGGARVTLEYRVLGSLIHSQAELHSAYGGVYPNLAKREHGKNLIPLLHKLFLESGMESKPVSSEHFEETLSACVANLKSQNPDLAESFEHAEFLKQIPPIDAIAVTEGPGLEPALWVGIAAAEILAKLWNVPLIPVNHMEGHIVGSLLSGDTSSNKPGEKLREEWQTLQHAPMPAVALLISGGHTELARVDSIGTYKIVGETKDDAVGEAFDKTARLLGLPYPGGPHISRLAHEAWEAKISAPVTLPRPMISSGDLNFSFSGLKTAVLYAVRKATKPDGTLDETWKRGLAHEFETAVAETLEAKLRTAIEETAAQSVVIGGGVSANHVLRKRFQSVALEYGIPLFLPSPHISGDNALMITLSAALTGDFTSTRKLKAHGTMRLG